MSNFDDADNMEMMYDDGNIDLNCALYKGYASESGLKTKGCHTLGQPAFAGCVNVLGS